MKKHHKYIRLYDLTLDTGIGFATLLNLPFMFIILWLVWIMVSTNCACASVLYIIVLGMVICLFFLF